MWSVMRLFVWFLCTMHFNYIYHCQVLFKFKFLILHRTTLHLLLKSYLTSNLHVTPFRKICQFSVHHLGIEWWFALGDEQRFVDSSFEPIWRTCGQNFPIETVIRMFLEMFRGGRIMTRIFVLLPSQLCYLCGFSDVRDRWIFDAGCYYLRRNKNQENSYLRSSLKLNPSRFIFLMRDSQIKTSYVPIFRSSVHFMFTDISNCIWLFTLPIGKKFCPNAWMGFLVC